MCAMDIGRALRRRMRATRKWLIFRLINFWPPYLGSGIKVRTLDMAKGVVEVELGLHWWNRNYVGTQYGGSLYSMCDPFYMLILMENLGPRFIVWDKSGVVRFRRPGRGKVRARFEITPEEIERIRETAMRDGKVEPVFIAKVIDDDGQVVAEVEKLVHIKRDKSKKKRE